MEGGMRNDQWARADVISDKERDGGGFHSVDPGKCMKALKSQESLSVQGQKLEGGLHLDV